MGIESGENGAAVDWTAVAQHAGELLAQGIHRTNGVAHVLHCRNVLSIV
jgi:hypothetical protein